VNFLPIYNGRVFSSVKEIAEAIRSSGSEITLCAVQTEGGLAVYNAKLGGCVKGKGQIIFVDKSGAVERKCSTIN